MTTQPATPVFAAVTSESPRDTNAVGEIGRKIGLCRKADQPIPIPLDLSLEYMDAAVPAAVATLLPRRTMTRDAVFAAHEAAFGPRPSSKDHPAEHAAWQKAHDSNVTRLTRAGLMLTANLEIAVPAGRTKNTGARGPRNMGDAGVDSSGATYLGEPMSRVDFAIIVKLLHRRIDQEALCDTGRQLGYTIEADVHYDDDDQEVVAPWMVFFDPKPMSAHQRQRAAAVAKIGADCDELVEAGDMLPERRAAAVERRVAKWDTEHPDPDAPKAVAVEPAKVEAPKAEVEAPKAKVEAPKVEVEAPPVPPADLTTAPEGETKTAQKKRERALREWKTERGL